jgi:hypothetical protein
MKKTYNTSSNYSWVFAYIVGVLGYNLNNNSLFWGIIDGLFYPIVLIKWLICEELTLSLVKQSFPFFFN